MYADPSLEDTDPDPSLENADPSLGYSTLKETEVKLDRKGTEVKLARKETEVKLAIHTRVKNKSAAPVQITAEQILRMARERQKPDIGPSKQKIMDPAELAYYRLRKRKEFEACVRLGKSIWVKYAKWEESQKDFRRARSVLERALKVDSHDHTMLLMYARLEMKCNEVARARSVFERFVQCHPKVSAWIKFAEFEMKNGEIARVRNCYERALYELEDDEDAVQLFVAFAEFEKKCKATERARSIYKYALDRFPKGQTVDLYRKFVAFENQYGDGIEASILGKMRVQYEDEVRKNPWNYDAWFDYIRLEESVGTEERIREVYERAIANVPLAEEKRYWQRYIYLWINYALYEELDAQDVKRTRSVYRECLNLIPHRKFSFAKIWLLAAEFEIRRLRVEKARQLLGEAIDRAAKGKIFKGYIEIEQHLGNMDQCRKIYLKYLDWSPGNCDAWCKFAELERSLCETERVRAIFEFAVEQPVLDMPELLWKAYIDFEMSEGEFERTRKLYERLLNRTKILKVWISFAKFEASAMDSEVVAAMDSEAVAAMDSEAVEDIQQKKKKCLHNARDVFERAITYLRTFTPELKEERAMVLDEWLKVERSFGELGDVNSVLSMLPKKLKKKRKQIDSDEGPAVYEEYLDYLLTEEMQGSKRQQDASKDD